MSEDDRDDTRRYEETTSIERRRSAGPFRAEKRVAPAMGQSHETPLCKTALGRQAHPPAVRCSPPWRSRFAAAAHPLSPVRPFADGRAVVLLSGEPG